VNFTRGRPCGSPAAFSAASIASQPSQLTASGTTLGEQGVGRLAARRRRARAAVLGEVLQQVPDAVSWEGWEAIDAAEKAAGEPQGRPRVKFTSVAEMLEAAKGSAISTSHQA